MEKEENRSFESLGISENILKAIEDMGFEQPTTIQTESIRIMNTGRDVIGQSQTGTGKTVAFGIPCIERIDQNDRSLQCVVLCPTRELAIQISEEFRRLLRYSDNVKVLAVYGGQPISRQIQALSRGVQIVIGTPGRVMDHMRRRTIKMETVKTFVLDEADEMLDMGFREDIETVLGKVSSERQTMLYSATLSKDIMNLSKKYTVNPEIIRVERSQLTLPNIEQIYFDIKANAKLEALCRLIDMEEAKLTAVFSNTKRGVDRLVEQLAARGYYAEGLHGDLRQTQRDSVMQGFRDGKTEILVATDVAARGIDVDDIDMVVNYDLPQDEEYYVHRIGRTGRAGKSGKAYTFVVGKEVYRLKGIMKYTGSTIHRGTLPTATDIEELKMTSLKDKITKIIEEGSLTEFATIVESVLGDEYSSMDVASAVLKLYTDENKFFDDKRKEIDFAPHSGGGRNDDRGRRNTSREARPRREHGDENMVRLSVNLGRQNHITPGDIVGAIAGESNIPGKAIGAIDIFDDFTLVDIPDEYANKVLESMEGNTVKGKTVSIERAKPGQGGGARNSARRAPGGRSASGGSSSNRRRRR